ncbi:MAG TPA: MFS transporter [Terriglobales bacterium]|jgi:ACS family hexuronate transporter-like MFS transporter
MRERRRSPVAHLRWIIITVSFLATTVNYLDRQCLSVAAPTISKEFHFSNTDYSTIVSSFLIAYAIMQLIAGGIVDRLGVRRSMAAFLSWWSVAGALHALCNGLWSFRIFRFLLGMGEAGNWPASSRAVSEWFPSRERGLATAIFDSGSSLGGLLAPPLVAWLILIHGWRAAFLVTGCLGFLVLVLWIWIYQKPECHRSISSAELQLILSDRPKDRVEDPRRSGWIFRTSEVWGVVAGRFLSDCVWWFYVYWLPKYLADQRGFSLIEIASVSWIPFVSVDLGNMFGGWFSGVLMRRNRDLNFSRKCILRMGVIGMLSGVPAGFVDNAAVSVALISLVTFSYGMWGTMMLTLPTDLYPTSHVGLVSGLCGTGAGIGGIIFTSLIGIVVDSISYKPIFITAAILPVIALISVETLVPKIRYLGSPG